MSDFDKAWEKIRTPGDALTGAWDRGSAMPTKVGESGLGIVSTSTPRRAGESEYSTFDQARAEGYSYGWTEAMDEYGYIMDLPPEEKRKEIRKLRKELKISNKRTKELINRKRRLLAKKHMLEILELCEAEENPPKFEKITNSKTAYITEVVKQGEMFAIDQDAGNLREVDAKSQIHYEHCINRSEIIILHNDHTQLIANKEELKTSDWRMPYDGMIFEARLRFEMATIHFLLFMEQNEKYEGGKLAYILTIGAYYSGFESWMTFMEGDETARCSLVDGTHYGDWPFASWMVERARAACILMDAEVIEREQHRIDARLNDTRIKRGKVPFYSFHTLKLRERVAYGGMDMEPGDKRRSPRLHLRRGHWRRVGRYKTWVRWSVVGRGELGVVDKDYAL